VDFPYLDVDSQTGMRQLTQHMIDLGHQRIAHICAPPDLMFASHRLEGYKQALLSNGIPFSQALVTMGELTERSGYITGRELLTQAAPPTAIIASNDLMALGVINAAQELGLEVGQDVAVAGFDDIAVAEHTRPPLTTVRQPIYDIGRRVCAMLIVLLREQTLKNDHVILQPQLIIRQSCRASKRSAQKSNKEVINADK
jgi:DNA-binding LacI/PurR family transcriptional regulator